MEHVRPRSRRRGSAIGEGKLPLLVGTDWLGAHLNEPTLRVFDCTGSFASDAQMNYRSESARARYEEGHIPGAGYLDLHEELSDPEGRFMYTVPPPERFALTMSRHGVGEGTHVVLYGKGGPTWATRVWWMLRLFDFEEAAVLDGGWEKWVREGRALSKGSEGYDPARFQARFRPELLTTKSEVAAAMGSARACLVSALPRTKYTGEDDAHFGRPGHIPGSVNLPYLDLLDPQDGTFLPEVEIQQRLKAVGALDAPRVLAYCGGGMASTVISFARALVRRTDTAVYDGSMIEWSADRALPLEKGSPGDR